MGPPSTKPLSLLFLSLPFLSLLLLLSSSSSSSDLTDLIYKGCANQKFQDPSGSIESQNLQSLYNTLVSQSSATNFYKTTSGGNDQSATSITGLYQCRGDLSHTDCNTCVKKLPEAIRKSCGGDTIAARVQLTGCYMRYEVAGFPQVSATALLYKQCGSGQASGSGFDVRLQSALAEITKGVGNGNGFYAGAYQSVYVLGQCEGGLGNGDCVNCVKSAVANAESECGNSLSGHIFLQLCYISYTYYPNGAPGAGGGGGGGGSGAGAIETGATETGGGHKYNTQKTVAIVFGGVAGLGLTVAFLLVIKSAFKKKKEKYSYGGY